MPSDEDQRLAKKIVEAYRESGICARLHRGTILVERENGWEGPFDPHALETTHGSDTARVHQSVRDTIAACYARWVEQHPDDPNLDVLSRLRKSDGSPEARKRAWLMFVLRPHDLVGMGLSEEKAWTYVLVARRLECRNELW